MPLPADGRSAGFYGLFGHAAYGQRQRFLAAGHRQQPDRRSDRTGEQTRRQGSWQSVLSTADFIDPLIYYNQNGVYRFGTTGRNILRGPGYWQLSPAIYKDFRIREKVNAEFRAEATNLTNTPIWGNPNAGSANL